ncbi:MAG TPA: class I SAM-dependent methyltransferase [Verrucomicrobiae bacterium]|nr:class I SAM-dependent methyltransferase [Verrucomicrobiae bacterium]
MREGFGTKTRFKSVAWGLVLLANLCFGASGDTNRYEFRAAHDPDGIGKIYMGREIAQVMGHQGADWLERPERELEEQPDKMVGLLGIKPGQVLADIGAGTGYMSRRLALNTGRGGKVLAVDIQPEMLDLLRQNMASAGISNVVPVLGTESDPKLPENAVDLVLMVDVYHEFDFPYEMMSNICRALKPKGRVVFVEFRAEDPNVPIKPLHKMSEKQVRKEMSTFPLRWIFSNETLPRQHVLFFEKTP